VKNGLQFPLPCSNVLCNALKKLTPLALGNSSEATIGKQTRKPWCLVNVFAPTCNGARLYRWVYTTRKSHLQYSNQLSSDWLRSCGKTETESTKID